MSSLFPDESEVVTVNSREAGDAPDVSDSDFERLSVLGVGSFGKVVLARHRRSGIRYAIKVIALSRLTLRKQLERTQLERDVLVGLEHAFIVKLYYAYRVPGHVALVFERVLRRPSNRRPRVTALGRFEQSPETPLPLT